METKPSDIILLPMWSLYECDDVNLRSAVCVIRSDAVACDMIHSDQNCDASGIFYSGWTTDRVPTTAMLCPRHWYEPHFRCGTHCRLEDMTDEEYEEQLAAFRPQQCSGKVS